MEDDPLYGESKDDISESEVNEILDAMVAFVTESPPELTNSFFESEDDDDKEIGNKSSNKGFWLEKKELEKLIEEMKKSFEDGLLKTL